jgi:putative ABC transporter-associated repeat protein
VRAILLATACALALAPAAHAETVLDGGHADYGVRIVDGALRSQVKDDSAGGEPVWREVGEVLVRLDAAARATVPAGASWGFLGSPGATIWVVPQVQKPGVVWLGWNTEALSAADVDGAVRWRLTAVEGPGTVAVFQTGAFGQVDRLFDSGDGLPDARDVPVGTHAHGNWAFTRPGTYALTFEHSAQRAGGALQTDTRTLRVHVDDGSATTPPPDQAPSADPPPGGAPPADERGASRPAGPRLALLRMRTRGRVVTLRLSLARTSRVHVVFRRKGDVAARARRRTVAEGTRTLRFRLDRRLAPGRYVLRVRAVADGQASVRTRRVRVTARGG